VLAASDLQAGQLSRQDYDAIFVKKPTIVVAYNDVVCYGIQSLKQNDYATTQLHHTIMIQMLTKARKSWLRLKCPFKINKFIDDQMKFLRNLPSITKVAPLGNNDSMKYTKEF
jgi:hypothetical protein